MKMISRSLRLQRGSSLNNRLERSNSTLLASEFVSPSFTAYEKLSQSSRFADETSHRSYSRHHDHHRMGHKSRLSFLAKVFSSFKRTEGMPDRTVKPVKSTLVEKKKKSSWLPDPQHRWPVQGW